MTTRTIILIVIVAALAWVLRNKRTEHRRFEAKVIRDNATEQSHKVGQREALTTETAAKARAAQAEAEAEEAHAAGLQHQAQTRRSDAATARDEVNQEFERAHKVDPDSQAGETERDDSETRDTPRGTSTGKQAPPATPRAG